MKGEVLPVGDLDAMSAQGLTETIRSGLSSFVVVGKALACVRDGKRYRELGYGTFEEYCRTEFEIGRNYAHKTIAAASAAEFLCTMVHKKPRTERQVRPLASLPQGEQVAAWDLACEIAGDDDVTESLVRQAVRELARRGREESLAEINEGNQSLDGIGPWPVIYADPPWQYREGTVDPTRKIENHYPTMATSEIASLDVASVAEDHAVLFMWATAPLLHDALHVMRGWGFAYKTQAVWDKEKIGPGFWFRGQHEILMVGIRGNPPTPDPRSLRSSVIREARTRHSVKPDQVYGLIESYYPRLSKVELFARQPREGWASWGNQA